MFFTFLIGVLHVICSDRSIRTGQYRKKAPRRIIRINTGLAAFKTYKRIEYTNATYHLAVECFAELCFDPWNRFCIFWRRICENIQKIMPNIFKLVEQLGTASHTIYFFFFQYCLTNIKYLIFTFTSLYWKVNQTSNGMPHSIRIETASKILRRIQFKVRTHGLGSSQVTQPGSHIKHW